MWSIKKFSFAMLLSSALAILRVEHYSPTFFDAEDFTKIQEVVSAKTLNQCAAFCAKLGDAKCPGFSWDEDICSLGVLSPDAKAGDLMVFANPKHHPRTLVSTTPTETDATPMDLPSSTTSSSIEKSTKTATPSDSQETGSLHALSSTPIHPYVCSQVKTESADLEFKYCKHFDSQEANVLAECLSNWLVGLQMDSGQYVNVEVREKKRIDAVLIEFIGGFPDTINLRLEVDSKSSDRKKLIGSKKWRKIRKASSESSATREDDFSEDGDADVDESFYRLDHYQLGENRHLYVGEHLPEFEGSVSLKFGNMNALGTIVFIDFLEKCTDKPEFDKFIKETYTQISCDGKVEIKEIDGDISCQGLDCSSMLDDDLFTGFIWPKSSVQFRISDKDVPSVSSVLFHFNPRMNIPQTIVLSNCGSKSQSFDLADESINYLILAESWKTKCIDVTFGPSKYIRNSTNDNIVVQTAFWVGQQCN